MLRERRRIHLLCFFHSLRFRLLLMFLLIVLVTVGVVSLLAERNTAGSFRKYIVVKEQNAIQLAMNELNSYNLKSQGNPDLQVEQAMVHQIALNYNLRVIVITPATPSGYVIADSERKLIGSEFSSVKGPTKRSERTTVPVFSCGDLPPNTIVVATNALSFCTDRLGSVVGPVESPEQTFLNSVDGSLFSGVFVAGLIALILALAFSYTIIKPIKHLTAVARRMQDGDLSQRVRFQSHDEIGELAGALNAMADGLQRSERLRRNMINDIAHELRTPLTTIRGYLEALQDRVVDPTPEVIASLYEESSLLTCLVTDLQDLSMAEAGRLVLVRRPLALNESILKAVHMLQLQAVSKQISLTVDLPVSLPWVEADPGRIGQILRNLICNAITHTPASGKITVSIVEQEDEITVSVRDSGCGIAAHHLPYIFERFYRADPSRTRTTGGSGLGLAIVKQIVQAHGGRVRVESQLGHGSCFAFTLPTLSSSQPLPLSYINR